MGCHTATCDLKAANGVRDDCQLFLHIHVCRRLQHLAKGSGLLGFHAQKGPQSLVTRGLRQLELNKQIKTVRVRETIKDGSLSCSWLKLVYQLLKMCAPSSTKRLNIFIINANFCYLAVLSVCWNTATRFVQLRQSWKMCLRSSYQSNGDVGTKTVRKCKHFYVL